MPNVDPHDDLLVERGARATYLYSGGDDRPESAWRDLAPTLKERQRERVRGVLDFLNRSLAGLS